MAISKEIHELLGWIKTEITSGMVLVPRTDPERAHNNASNRATEIISNYQNDMGLFQMTRRAANGNHAGTKVPAGSKQKSKSR